MNASKGFYPTFLYWMEGEEQEPTGIISKLHTTRLMSTVDHQHPYPVRFQYIEVLPDVHGPTPVLPPAFDVCSTYRCWAYFSFFLSFFNLTYSRWTSSLSPSCLWSQRIFPSLPGSRLTIFYRDASSALLQLVSQWLNFTYSRSHAFRYERKNTYSSLVRIKLTTSALAGVQVNY